MKQISFLMRQIRVNQFAILSDDAPNGERIAVAYKTQYMNGSAPMLLLEIQCDFQVKPEDWDSLVNDGKLVFPVEFLRHIALHTVGSARGILFCKTEGSPFSKFILPPVNLEKMINQDLEIPLSE